MNKKIRTWGLWLSLFVILLLLAGVFSFFTGPAGISPAEVFRTISEGAGTTEHAILFEIRLPRVLLGFAIGGALGLAGVILQGMFRNPLVEPYTLGISGGAALGVCLNVITGLNNVSVLSLPLSGFAGAAASIIFVYFLSIRSGVLKIHTLLLMGVMISFISSSLIMLTLSVTRTENLHGIIFWIMGSLGEPSRELIKLAVLVSVAGLAVSYLFCLDLNAFALGEEESRHLGVNTERTKRLLFGLASVLTGMSVSVAGVIGFVGLVVPHFVRMFVGGDHRILLVSSFIAGAIFLILCDTLARIVISPMELPVGVLTGILGGVVFIYAMMRKSGSIRGG